LSPRFATASDRVGCRSRYVSACSTRRFGTIELWCESTTTDHRWRLQFNLRAREDASDREESSDTSEVVVSDEAVAAGEQLLRESFASAERAPVDAVTGQLENLLGHGKHAWPLPVLRRFADVLLNLPDARRLSARHEARWLNLTGLCMRPGFGTSLDPWRISEIRKVYAADLAFSEGRAVPGRVADSLWQRVSAGFSASQQQELATRLTGLLGMGGEEGAATQPADDA
jgi:hypothetical protein